MDRAKRDDWIAKRYMALRRSKRQSEVVNILADRYELGYQTILKIVTITKKRWRENSGL